jgi:hypothetical protein
MGTRSDTVVGSLRVVPKHPGHVHGDGDDGTTTRMNKAVAMANGINLNSPAAVSMDRHRDAQKKIRRLAFSIGVGVLTGCAVIMVWESWPKIMGWLG